MTTTFSTRKLTQDELLTELHERCGTDPMQWAFICPNCETITTSQEMANALKAYPQQNRSGNPVIASDVIGQECIGRIDPDQGCNWAAFGLFRGPWEIELPNGDSMWCFPIASKRID